MDPPEVVDVDEKEVRVTEWSIEDVEMGDIVVVRCANPGDDIHTLKVDMKDGTREFVWICKAKRNIREEDRTLEGVWFKNDKRSILYKLHRGLEDSCEIEDNLDILCIYPDTPMAFQLQAHNHKEIVETLLARRSRRQGAGKAAARADGKADKASAKPSTAPKTKSGGVTKTRGKAAANGKSKGK